MELDNSFNEYIKKIQEQMKGLQNPVFNELHKISSFSKIAYLNIDKPITNFDNLVPLVNSIQKSFKEIKIVESKINKDVLDVINKNSISSFVEFDWKKSFPQLSLDEISQDKIKYLQSLNLNDSYFKQVLRLNENLTKISDLFQVSNFTINDALDVAINIEKDTNNNTEVVEEILNETNNFVENIQKGSLNTLDGIYDLYDKYLIKINNIKVSKNVRDILIGVISGIISSLFVLFIQVQFVNNNTVPNTIVNVTNNTTVNNNVYNVQPKNISQIEIGKIYSSNITKLLKSDRKDISKTLIEISAGTKIKIIKKYKKWLWVRVIGIDGFPYGYVKNGDLYLTES